MLIFKIIAVGLIVLLTMSILVKNTNKWAVHFRQYMLNQTNKVFGHGIGWEKPWALILSKAMIIFFALMFIVLVYVVVFSLW